MTQNNGPEPWYSPNRKKAGGTAAGPIVPGSAGSALATGGGAASGLDRAPSSRGFISAPGLFQATKRLANGIGALIITIAAGGCVGYALAEGTNAGLGVLLVLAAVVLFVVAVLLLLRQVGRTFASVSEKHADHEVLPLAFGVLRGDLKAEESRKGMPAPEMALHQFVQQVRAYATEKAYQKNRQELGPASTHPPLVAEPVDLLKRRWNEVLDSLNEFEIYLANDPQGMITKLVTKHPNQTIDVSQVFRDVAESFDTTWRRKGINIESAIVTPLRANTNEALLRRLLVGPWRSCAYFARRGGGVLFSAKSVEGKVVARWECEGLSIHDDYLKLALRSDTPVNERIEKGLQVVAPDPNSPNTLHALISFITWIDLAQAVGADFAFKHTNDGFVIELRLK